VNYLTEIKKFRDGLIKSDIGHQITKMVWFGSTLKKRAHRDSDVDILIVTRNGKAVQDRIADILLEFQMSTWVSPPVLWEKGCPGSCNCCGENFFFCTDLLSITKRKRNFEDR